MDNKISGAPADGIKNKTYVLVTNGYNGYVRIVAAVQEFETNLWVRISTNLKEQNTTCRERTGEACIEAKVVNAKKSMRLERKCIFVGSKDS